MIGTSSLKPNVSMGYYSRRNAKNNSSSGHQHDPAPESVIGQHKNPIDLLKAQSESGTRTTLMLVSGEEWFLFYGMTAVNGAIMVLAFVPLRE